MQSPFTGLRNRLLITVSALMLTIFIGTGLLQAELAKRNAEKEAVTQGELVLKQTRLLARPLLLSNDRVSLNYLLNELVTLPYIRAAQLQTNREGVIARAGDAAGIQMQQALTSKQESHLSIWLDPTPLKRPLLKQLQISAIAAVLALLGCIAAILMIFNRHRAPTAISDEQRIQPTISTSAPVVENEPTNVPSLEPEITVSNNQPENTGTEEITPPAPITPDTTELEKGVQEPQEAETIPEPKWEPEATTYTESSESEELPPRQKESVDDIPFIGELSNAPTLLEVEREVADQENNTDSASPDFTLDEFDRASQELTQENNTPQPSIASFENPTSSGPAAEPVEESSDNKVNAPHQSATPIEKATPNNEPEEPNLETASLVSLLRPDLVERSMPQFQPSSTPADSQPEPEEQLPTFEETEISREQQPDYHVDTHQAPATTVNPLRAVRDEEQLSLYSMEHELELVLSAEDAAYCLYVDTSAHAGNAEEHERQQLLKTYTRLAGQTAAIYNGALLELKNGDIVLKFDRSTPDDNHGINAVCASALFNLLYKGFNQLRIRSFQPALNLRMALARGQRDKGTLLIEEARFLTHTTQSNELISHTALTEVAALKNKLMDGANIRREDEDKVLIMALNDNVQELLAKQANHLLGKLDS